MNRRRRQSLIAVTVAALAVSLGAVGITLSGTPAAAPAPARGEGPGALGAHLEQVMRAAPNNVEIEEGPAGAAQDEFEARAYPAKTISVAKVEAAKDAFREALADTQQLERAQLGQPGAAAAPAGAWELVGPSRALYPDTRRRNATNYVPNKYIAGGRTTDLAIADRCVAGDCRMWITPAGGGVWRTENAMARPARWTYLGGPLGINAAGSVTIDPRDPSGNTIWVGTGEANICGSGCVAGVGIYKSTDGGDTFRGPLGREELSGKGVAEIAFDPRDNGVVYAATTTALRGHSSVCCSGATRPVPGADEWGLYKSADNGRSWTMIHNGTVDESVCDASIDQYNNLRPCSPRGVRNFEIDPNDPDILYASSYARGIWRSSDAGDTWVQIKESINATQITSRPAFDVVALENGLTRMYVHEGNVGLPPAATFRSDNVSTGVPAFVQLSNPSPAAPGYATYNMCGGQCWYDLFVTASDADPDTVYFGGSYSYGETNEISNGRAVVLSTDAGLTGTDMTMDGTDNVHPNALHPDQHALVLHPSKPNIFFEANDGGVMRSNGRYSDRSGWCTRPYRDDFTDPTRLQRCEQLLSKVPRRLIGMNHGLSTLQFQSLSVSPHDSGLLQGGTQDNGTWENKDGPVTWINTMIGDGGQSGFDAENENFRFHSFFDASPEVNFNNGDIDDWIYIADPIGFLGGAQFYSPIISDPKVSGTMFAGNGITVYRTKTHGLGNRSMAEAQRICNTWDGTFEETCGDWKKAGPNDLTSTVYGADRAGPAISAVERATTDTNTAWAATTTGRLFISTSIDARFAGRISWRRLDTDSTIDPQRFISSIDIHPQRPNVAYVSYSGYDATTPLTPGHVFKVTFDGSKATWEDLSGSLQDIPVTDLVRDDRTADLYASTDFGVLRRPAGTNEWVLAAPGMPRVEVAGLTIVPEDRLLYAASHGRSAWRLRL